MVSGVLQILKGETPSDALGGPLMMYRVASVSGNQGWDSFLLMLALISINLGLINLLPIPMLDGGHLLVFAIEAVRRRPLSTWLRERVQLGGLIVVGIITVLALRNDSCATSCGEAARLDTATRPPRSRSWTAMCSPRRATPPRARRGPVGRDRSVWVPRRRRGARGPFEAIA